MFPWTLNLLESLLHGREPLHNLHHILHQVAGIPLFLPILNLLQYHCHLHIVGMPHDLRKHLRYLPSDQQSKLLLVYTFESLHQLINLRYNIAEVLGECLVEGTV